jgi:hypothetical protein
MIYLFAELWPQKCELDFLPMLCFGVGRHLFHVQARLKHICVSPPSRLVVWLFSGYNNLLLQKTRSALEKAIIVHTMLNGTLPQNNQPFRSKKKSVMFCGNFTGSNAWKYGAAHEDHAGTLSHVLPSSDMESASS